MTTVSGNATTKLITFECGCAIRLFRGDIKRNNFCKEHWNELNKMESEE